MQFVVNNIPDGFVGETVPVGFAGWGKASAVQLPGGAVLGVLHLEAGGGQLVADEVAGGPVLGGLGLGAQVEDHVDDVAEGLLALRIRGRALLWLEAQQVLDEEVHHLPQLSEAVGADGGLVVLQLVNDGASLEEVADELRRGQVVVHGVVAALAQSADDALRLGVALL